MQKLVWKNSLGDSVDLTKAPYGITNWEGFANTSLNIQSQQVPFQDGGVFLDALLEQREITVTLAIQDNNNLENRYKYRRELIHILNPKLGEGYLIYTNDFISKRIKCIAEVPLFETHNSNDSGTPKASLTWVACEPYWEDLEQKSVSILSGGIFKVRNEGDVAISPTDIYVWGEGSNVSIKNLTNNTQLKINGAVKDINATLGMGQKDARLTKQYISFLAGGKTVETDYAQYTIASNCILKTSDFKTVENVKQFSSVSDITSDGKNIYVCDSTFIGMIKENGDYVERTDINASRIFYSKNKQKIYYSSSSPSGIYSLDSFDATPVLVTTTEYQIYYFSDVGNDVLCCGAMGLLVNLTQNTVIPTNAGNKVLKCVAPYKNGYAVVGASGFAQYNENGTWTDIPLNASAMLNEFCHNPYTDSYYFGGYSGFLAEIKSDNTKVVINTHTDGIVSYAFFSKIFETVQLVIDSGIAQIKNETELEIISKNDTNLTCCKYVDFLGKYVAGSQDAIFTSSDFNVWEQVYSESGIGIFTHIESDNTHVLLGISDSDNLYESSDGVNFTKKQSIVGKFWVTYNTEAEKFFFIGDFGNNEYWICSADSLLSYNITKIYELNSDWNTYNTNSVSNGSTTIFILSQNNANSILYYTTNAGETWTEKTTALSELSQMFTQMFISTRVVDNKILITLAKHSDHSLPLLVMWDSQQEDFIIPTFVTDEDYLALEVNYVSNAPYIGGYINNGESDAKRCVIHISVEGTTVTLTKMVEGLYEDMQLYMTAFDVGNQFVYTYLGRNGSTYAYYNGTAHEGSVILKLKGYVAILIPGDLYWSICDNNFTEIRRVSYDYLGNYILSLPTNDSVLSSDGEEWAILTDDWLLVKVPQYTGNITCLFNFNDNIYMSSSHSIYNDTYNAMWEEEYSEIKDCKVLNNKLYICLTNGYVKILDENFNEVQSIDVYPTFDKIYPLANGDIIGFAKSGDTKSIYKYDHNTNQTKKIYELTDQVTTFYDLGYFEKLNEVLLITNRGFLGIIDDYVTELLNSQYLTYAFVKNQQPRFVGVWGFKGTVDFTEGSSIINQVQDMTLKLEVGDNNLVFGYEGSSSMMLSLIYSPKYIGV